METTEVEVKKNEKKAEEHELHPLVKKVLADVRLVMVGVGGLIVLIWLGGWTAFGQVRTIATDAGAEQAKSIGDELQRVKAAQVKAELDNAELHRAQQQKAEDQAKQLENLRVVTFETNLNVRLLVESMGRKPISVIPPTEIKDGGQ